MLKALVIDDEPMAHEVIRSFAEKLSMVDVQGYYANPLAAMAFMQQNEVDLLFLDIEMAGFSGIDLVKILTRPPMVIFTTAFSQYAVEGFELNAVDYLLKPFSLTRFIIACNRAYDLQRLNHPNRISASRPDHLFLKSGTDREKLLIREIQYVESKANYAEFVTTAGKILSRITMKEADAMLEPYGFLRIHRSFLVAVKHITRYNKKEVFMGDTQLPVGENYAENFLQIMVQGA